MARRPGISTPTVEVVAGLRYRELLRHLVVRDLKIKYQRSVLGFIWTLLNPVLTISVMVVVFGYILKVRVPHYWAFLLSSYFVWNFVMQSLGSATSILGQHSSLLRSVAVPAEVFVLAAIASRLVEFAIELSFALIALMLFHHFGAPASLILLPLLVVVQFVLAIGLVMPLATFSAFYEDVQHALPVVLLILFYVSPVFYPLSLVPEALRGVFHVNPVASLMTLYYIVLYEGRFPPLWLLGWTTLFAALVFIVGHRIFRRYRSTLAEIL